MENFNVFDAEFINLFYKILPILLSLFGFFFAFFLYTFKSSVLFYIKKKNVGKKVYFLFNRKWFVDKIYNEYLSQIFFRFGYSTSYKVWTKYS